MACSAAIQTEAHKRRRRDAAAQLEEGAVGESPGLGASAKVVAAAAAAHAADAAEPAPVHDMQDAAAAAALLSPSDVAALEASCLEAVKRFSGSAADCEHLRSLGQQLSHAHAQAHTLKHDTPAF